MTDSLSLFPSEDELPPPTAQEEKVKGLRAGRSCVFFLYSPASFTWTAEAAGGGESREVAEDGEEVGQVQEQ